MWLTRRAPRVPVRGLTRDLHADVLVVGMGISGAMIVEALAATGFDVLAIDRRGPFQGSTSASSALVIHEVDAPLVKLSSAIGPEKAERAWKRSRLAVANLSTRIEELRIACDRSVRSSLLLSGSQMGAAELRREAAARRGIGLYAEFLPRRSLFERFGVARSGAILTAGNLAVDPRQLTSGLLRHAIACGARCYAPVRATAVEEGHGRVTVTTAEGPLITAARVVLATGYEQLIPVPPSARHWIASTWVIATRPQRRLWAEETMIWEASDPYLYLRTTRDKRVICGGEDEDFSDETARDALIPRKTKRLAAKLARLFPSIDASPEFAWAGSFGNTPTGLPYIGLVPGYSLVHSVMGYGGNGFAFSRIAAEMLRAEFTGTPDADRDIFAFVESQRSSP